MNSNEIINTCVQYSQNGCYTGDYIPQKKLNNAKAHYPIPHQETIIVLIDTTVGGSAKTGIAIGENGVYWKNDWTTKTRQNYYSWSEFMKADIQAKGLFDIVLGPGNVLNTSGCSMKRAEIIALLNDVRILVSGAIEEVAVTREPLKNTPFNPPPLPQNSQWMLGINGQQYGPYSLADIESMVHQNNINPELCYAWREGMPNWVIFNTVAEFQSLLSSKRPPFPPSML